MKSDSMDAIFAALAHASRRRILDIVREHGGSSVNEVASYFDTSRIAVMKHLRVLEDADLIVSKKDGRTRRLFFNAVPIQMIHDRWTSEYSALWASKLTRMKYEIERGLAPPEGGSRTPAPKTKPKPGRPKKKAGPKRRKPRDG
jgi:DNA-binding transcriptional ArsR family regulator